MSRPNRRFLHPGSPAVLLATAPQPSEEAVRRTLQEVLSRPEFTPETPPAWIAWLLRHLEEWLSGLAFLHQSAPILFWLVLLGCLLLLVLLLGYIGWTVRRVL